MTIFTSRLHAKNAVEEYVYDIRSKINDELTDYITEEDRAKFATELEDAENWLYEDGEDCAQDVYTEKLRQLRLKGEPIKKRKQEFEERPKAVDALGKAIQQASKAIDLYRQGDEKYAHIDREEMEKVVKALEEKRAWLDENCATLKALSKTINPPVLAAQFYSERQTLENIASRVLNKPKPKVEPPPKEEDGGRKNDGSEDKAKGNTNGDPVGDNPAEAKQQSASQAVNGEGQMDLD